MTKTAVSALQEYRQRLQKPVPIYVEIPIAYKETPIFKYRCTCDNQTAFGEAENKKTAKHRAAAAMLQLLKVPGYEQFESPVHSVSSSPEKESPRVEVDFIPGSSVYHSNSSSRPEPPVNFVGQLLELCVARKMLVPVYRETQLMGPSHLPRFTIECKIGTTGVSATDSTKKRAKQWAAAAMLDMLKEKYNVMYKIQDMSPAKSLDLVDVTGDLEQLKIQESSDFIKATERAKSLYPELKKSGVQSTATPKTVTIANYHAVFKESFSAQTLRSFYSYYEKLTISETNSRLDLDTFFQKICEILQISCEKVMLQLRQNNHAEPYIVAYKLQSTPPLVEFGTGKTLEAAHKHALTRTISLIHLLLI